jgi:RHS repeat-associated protein
MEYDHSGHQTKLIDKNAGTTEYRYSIFKELMYQKDANNNAYEMSYDQLGRIIAKQELISGQTTHYTYVANGNGINQLEKTKESTHNISETYTYDNINRVIQLKETIDNQDYNTDYVYDTYSNLVATTSPSGFRVDKHYTEHGYLDQVKHGNQTIWEATAMNAYLQYTETSKGNGLSTIKSYNAHGLPTAYVVSDPSVQNLSFTFDLKNGNLLSREDMTQGLLETFEYDPLNRLIQTKLNGTTHFNMEYAKNGNISAKTDAGNYSYDGSKINAVASVSNPNTNISLLQQDITYTIFNSPKKITEDNHQLSLIYGPNEQRIKTIATDGTNTTTKYFLGDYEKIIDGASGTITEVNYIAGGDGLTAMYVQKNGIGEMHHVYTDHLGSILTVTDDAGEIEVKQNFDAWGRDRNPSTWDYAGANKVGNHNGFEWLHRGYTEHEHLSNFDLINMNGRVYDPILARMLSPDNYVQSPLNTQSYNRYSYVINNPLKYTDPSGEIWGWIGAAVSITWIYLKGVNDNGGNINLTQWSGTDANGNPLFYNFGVSIGGGGVNAIGFGLNSGSPTPNVFINMQPNLSTPGNNFSYVDASRFEPSYDFPAMREINPDYFNAKHAGNGGGSGEGRGIVMGGITGTLSLGIIGGSIELGLAMDGKDNIRPYVTLEHATGFDLSVGGVLNLHTPKGPGKLSFNDIEGYGESYNAALGPLDYTYGGNSLYQNSWTPDSHSNSFNIFKTEGFGVSVGTPIGTTYNKGNTWIFGKP